MTNIPKSVRMTMIDSESSLPVGGQCNLLGISRSSCCYQPKGESWDSLTLMRPMDCLHLSHPCWGRPQMTQNLRRMGYTVNHKRIGRLMRLMNIRSALPKPNTSKPNEAHEVYPYLLRGLETGPPNQVWSIDMAYIPMPRGFPVFGCHHWLV